MIDLSRLHLPFLRRRAASVIEYAILLTLITGAALGAVLLFGQRTGGLTERTVDILAGDAPPPGAPAGAPLQGILPGVLVWGPPFLDFPLSPVAPTVQATATLTNTGGGRSLPFSPPQISGPDAMAFSIVATDCPATLGAGESCTVTAAATAASNGVRTATLGAAGAPGGVSLSAVATGFDPLLAWSTPAAVAVDGTPGPEPLPRTHVQTLTLTNVGFADAPGIAPAVLAASGATATLTHDCPAVLLPSASCTVEVTVAAADNGPISATLTSGGSGPTQPVEVVLTGSATGFAPAFAWSGGGAFTLTAPGSNPATVAQTFTLTNVGTLAGPPPAPTVSGSGTGYAFDLDSTTCGPALDVGQACQAVVHAIFTDNVADATGTLAADAAVQPLSGSAAGFAAVLVWDSVPADFSLNVANGGVTEPATTTPGPTGTAVLRNAGTLPSGPISIAFAGPDSAAYEIVAGQDTCSGQALLPGATCTVGIRLVAGLFPGDYSLQLTASASPTVAAPPRTQRVIGPRLALVEQRFAGTAQTADHGVWSGALPPMTGGTDGGIREIRIRNVGNAPTGPMQADRAGLQDAGFTIAWRLDGPNGPVLIRNTAGTDADVSGAGPGAADAAIALNLGQDAVLHTRLMRGQDLHALTGPLTGTRSFAGVVRLGGATFPDADVSATYLAAPALAWEGGGSFAMTGITTPTATRDQTFTLRNTGNVAQTPPTPAVAGSGTGFSYALFGTTCGALLLPNATCTATVRATYTADVANAPGQLTASPATVALAGSAAGCVAGNQVFTTSGTFIRPPFFQSCTVRILAVGGGGGGGSGHGNRGIAGGGGGSGRVARYVGPSSNLPVGPIAVTVGIGGAGGLAATYSPPWNSQTWNGQNGQPSAFGSLLTAPGGAGGLTGACWWSFPTCDWANAPPSALGTGGGAPRPVGGYALAGSAGGTAGQAGASAGGGRPAYNIGFLVLPEANGQGSLFPLALSGFSQRTVDAGAGGNHSSSIAYSSVTIPGVGTFVQDTNDYRRGGGGGGGVLISGATPAQAAQAGTSAAQNSWPYDSGVWWLPLVDPLTLSDQHSWPYDAWVTVGGDPGQGFGAGGGGGTRHLGVGGQGASGVVYVEWSP